MFYILSLVIIFGISLPVCWHDLRHKKIKNSLLLAGFILGFTLMASYSFFDLESGYLAKVLLNTIISTLVSFGIWRAGYWPAGDSKYFILMSFLLPLQCYNGAYLEYFPAFLLLVNIFILFILFVLVKSLVYFFKEAWQILVFATREEKLNRLSRFKQFVMIKINQPKFFISLLVSLILSFAVYLILNSLFFKHPLNILNYLLFMLLFMAAKALLGFYSKMQKHDIAIERLKPGMNLSLELVSALKKDKRLMDLVGIIRADGLEEKQTRDVQEYFRDRKMPVISVYKTIPFSIWISFGVFATIIFNRLIINVLLNH